MASAREYTAQVLAEKAGINSETIRFYEGKGLLPEPKRKANGYRHYTNEDVHLLLFIKTCKELGFTLQEISELSTLSVDEGQSCKHLHAIAQQKAQAIQSKIHQLQCMYNSLQSFAHTCSGNESVENCHLVHSLWGEEDSCHG